MSHNYINFLQILLSTACYVNRLKALPISHLGGWWLAHTQLTEQLYV